MCIRDRSIFGSVPTINRAKAKETGSTVLKRVGGVDALIDRFPLDRGEANTSLVGLTLRIADALEPADRGIAEALRSEALRLVQSTTEAGERRHSETAAQVVSSLRELFQRPGVREIAIDESKERPDLAQAAVPKRIR